MSRRSSARSRFPPFDRSSRTTTGPATWSSRPQAISTTTASRRASRPVSPAVTVAVPPIARRRRARRSLSSSSRVTPSRPSWCSGYGHPIATHRTASSWRSSTTFSGADCPAGCSRRSERRGAWRTRSARIAAPTTMPELLAISVGTAPEHAHEVLGLLHTELDRLAAKGITPRELEVAKGHLRADLLLSLEDSGARMSRIGAGLLLFGTVLSVEELLARVAAVSADRGQGGRRAGADRTRGRWRSSGPSRRRTSSSSAYDARRGVRCRRPHGRDRVLGRARHHRSRAGRGRRSRRRGPASRRGRRLPGERPCACGVGRVAPRGRSGGGGGFHGRVRCP